MLDDVGEVVLAGNMFINNVDLDKYLEAFPEPVVGAIMQFLMVFGCCENMLKFLEERRERIRREMRERSVEQAEIARRRNLAHFGGYQRKDPPKGRVKERKPDPDRRQAPGHPMDLIWVTGVCPKCSSEVKGAPVPGCERRKSGRIFYSECVNPECPYYYEVITYKEDKMTKYYEVKGE